MVANNIHKPIAFEWKDSECKINITFSVEDDLAISLPKAPYSGFSIENSPSQNTINKIVAELRKKLLEKGVKKAIIRQRPVFQPNPVYQLLHDALILHEFEYTQEINQFVSLDQELERKLHIMQLRKIKKCQHAELTFQKEPSDRVEEVHAFLAKCRIQQGLNINIDNHALEELFLQLPLNYECYTIRNKENEIMASTILVIVNSQVVYNYLPGFDRNFKSLSPLSFLLYQLYELLRNRNFQIFDLGISSIQGNIQKGLFEYKKRMGAQCSDRFIYELNIK
ncbi:GNAT family N-acetyltransferase [Reichenbachiella sp.]|uniref:GNAT family N-acetyltransferase n=1 Tax=Reichenbachiella sp. TaxID=2184521 RepID=UPI003B5A9944